MVMEASTLDNLEDSSNQQAQRRTPSLNQLLEMDKNKDTAVIICRKIKNSMTLQAVVSDDA